MEKQHHVSSDFEDNELQEATKEAKMKTDEKRLKKERQNYKRFIRRGHICDLIVEASDWPQKDWEIMKEIVQENLVGHGEKKSAKTEAAKTTLLLTNHVEDDKDDEDVAKDQNEDDKKDKLQETTETHEDGYDSNDHNYYDYHKERQAEKRIVKSLKLYYWLWEAAVYWTQHEWEIMRTMVQKLLDEVEGWRTTRAEAERWRNTRTQTRKTPLLATDKTEDEKDDKDVEEDADVNEVGLAASMNVVYQKFKTFILSFQKQSF